MRALQKIEKNVLSMERIEMECTKGEKDILIELRHQKMEKPDTVDCLKNKPNWREAVATLLKKGLITKSAFAYSLTEKGSLCAARVYNERKTYFSTFYQRCSNSTAYKTLCERVYGFNLCQYNNMTLSQLEFLLTILTLDTTHRVLDMGCGLGMISEYISAVTGAAVTGLDMAEGAIEQAKERTKGKNRLTFVTGDFNKLEFDENSFDTVICIEAFYTGLDTTVRQLKKIISPGGQMGIHLMQQITPNGPRERLLPENTDLSIVLKKYNLHYRMWDFTSSTLDLFRNWIKASKELQPQFETENNSDLCNIGGHEKLLHLWETEDCMRQYLYHVVL